MLSGGIIIKAKKVLEDVLNINLRHDFQKKIFIKTRTIEDTIKTTALKKFSINKLIEYISYFSPMYVLPILNAYL